VDVFHPQTGEVRSDNAEASPAGSSIPTTTKKASSFAMPTSWVRTIRYSALKTTLKAEINEEAWATLNSDTLAAPSPNQNLDELR